MITFNNRRPYNDQIGWSTTKPNNIRIPNNGNSRLYAWARDAAGNVNKVAPSFLVNFTCCYEPTHLIVGNQLDSMKIFDINTQNNGSLTNIRSIGPNSSRSVSTHPSGRFIFSASTSNTTSGGVYSIDHLTSYKYDPISSNFSEISTISNLGATDFVIHPNGNYGYLLSKNGNSPSPLQHNGKIYPIQIANDGTIANYGYDVATTKAINIGNLTHVGQNSYKIFMNPLGTSVSFSNGRDLLMDSIQNDFQIVPMNWLDNWRLNLPSNAWGTDVNDISFHPNGKFAFQTFQHRDNDIFGLNVASVREDVNAWTFHQTIRGNNIYPGKPVKVHPNGNYVYAILDGFRVYSFDETSKSLIQIQIIDTQSLDSSWKWFSTTNIAIDDSGHFLYASTYSASGFKIAVFNINQSNGQLSFVEIVSTNSPNANYTSLAVNMRRDVNSAPIANAGEDRWVEFFTLAQINGQSPCVPSTFHQCPSIPSSRKVSLDGSKSFDPDASICNSGLLNASWRLVSVPSGSSLTPETIPGTGIILNYQSLNGANFEYDRPGSYEFELTVADSSGTCNGSTKTSKDRVVIKLGRKAAYVGTKLRYPDWRIPKPTNVPPEAILTWSARKEEAGYYEESWWTCLNLSIGACLRTNYCKSSYLLLRDEAKTQCDQQAGNISPFAFKIGGFVRQTQVTSYTPIYNWWF